MSRKRAAEDRVAAAAAAAAENTPTDGMDAASTSIRAEAEKLVSASRALFGDVACAQPHMEDEYLESAVLRHAVKTRDEYALVENLPPPAGVAAERKKSRVDAIAGRDKAQQQQQQRRGVGQVVEGPVPPPSHPASQPQTSSALVVRATERIKEEIGGGGGRGGQSGSFAIVQRKKTELIKPKWRPPWKLMRVISGHQGWVRAVAVDVANEWFATGSVDRTLKIWNLASGELMLTLTGHISTIRGIAISPRHPYLFTAGEDKQVFCWDLEQNKIVRHYHGHLSGVYAVAMHPTQDIIVTGGRDACARVWDIRSKQQIHCMTGHKDSVASIATMSTTPQIITGSHDSTCKLWDLRAGHSYVTLTHHKKAVRGLATHPSLRAFMTGSADNIKQWKCPNGELMQNFSGHNAIVNTLQINQDGVVASAADNGSLKFWDWNTGYNFCSLQTRVQPGSLDSEAGIFASCFDQTGSRYITAEADKTIKIWKEDEEATPETHPVEFIPKKETHF